MSLSWSQITWFAGKAVRTILVPQKRCLVCDHKFKCSCEKKNPVQCKQDIGPGKPGAKKKQLNPSGRVYESSLGFAVSGCLWGDFWQEQGKSPGAACMKQCPLVATWFFPCTKLHFYPPSTPLLVLNKMLQVHAEHVQSLPHLLEPLLQDWAMLCNLPATGLSYLSPMCDPFSIGNFSVKSY